VNPFCLTQQVGLSVQGFLEGPYGAGPLMSDALRTAGLLPTTEPYTGLGFAHVGGGGGETVQASVWNVTGNQAIVDWVMLELRSGSPAYTVVATRSALIQRDGDVVDVDGVSPVQFNVPSGNYHVALRHRNHLGVMTSSAVALSGTPVTVNLRSSATATYGTQSRKDIGGVQVLWAGNILNDGQLIYTGQANDRDPILVRIGGSVPTSTATGYWPEDTNMDGTVRYTGQNNDRDIILTGVGGSVPTATRADGLP